MKFCYIATARGCTASSVPDRLAGFNTSGSGFSSLPGCAELVSGGAVRRRAGYFSGISRKVSLSLA